MRDVRVEVVVNDKHTHCCKRCKKVSVTKREGDNAKRDTKSVNVKLNIKYSKFKKKKKYSLTATCTPSSGDSGTKERKTNVTMRNVRELKSDHRCR
jgi:hypothetical protein